jgi:hypothetical protein
LKVRQKIQTSIIDQPEVKGDLQIQVLDVDKLDVHFQKETMKSKQIFHFQRRKDKLI